MAVARPSARAGVLMLCGIAHGNGRHVPGVEWIGTVYVDLRPDNGLSRADLQAAADGGMRRVSFGQCQSKFLERGRAVA